MPIALNLAQVALGHPRSRTHPMLQVVAALQHDPPRRGRPPGSGKKPTTAQKASKGGRRAMSPAARKRQSEKMKAYWAARRKAAQ